mmetsp:Transcript_19882/g.28273  ORF Transcript_19882/g.28273 Transcript_19882/m.28273 type:complete len:205 (-) Transcript_19882:208-822(-)
MKLVSINSVSFLWFLPFLRTSFAINLRSNPSNVIDNTKEAAMEEEIWRSRNLFSMSMAVNDLKAAMEKLKSLTTSLGEPHLSGMSVVDASTVPTLYFGDTAINNSFDVVDQVKSEDVDNGIDATLFVNNGTNFVRVATTIKDDTGKRVIGTVLDPYGQAIQALTMNESYVGDADILGKPYYTDYEPITNSTGDVIGAFFAGHQK